MQTTQINKNLPRIPEGTYTIVFSDGDYQTVKFETVKEEGPFNGKRIASYLNGPDNNRNYKGFAFISKTQELHTWKKFENSPLKDKIKEAIRILYRQVKQEGQAATLKFSEEYAMKSGKCSKCGRKLTVPSSLHQGMGPECAKKSW